MSYGYHGDDGCAYAGWGFGRRFGPTFGTGQVVGSGLLLPHSPSMASAQIFFTVDGKYVGTPFTHVPNAEMLRPAIGVHSPGEVVELNFGSCRLLDAPPLQLVAPFRFDLLTARHSRAPQLGSDIAVTSLGRRGCEPPPAARSRV